MSFSLYKHPNCILLHISSLTCLCHLVLFENRQFIVLFFLFFLSIFYGFIMLFLLRQKQAAVTLRRTYIPCCMFYSILFTASVLSQVFNVFLKHRNKQSDYIIVNRFYLSKNLTDRERYPFLLI